MNFRPRKTDWKSVATPEEIEIIKAAKTRLKRIKDLEAEPRAEIDAIKSRCVLRAKGMEE